MLALVLKTYPFLLFLLAHPSPLSPSSLGLRLPFGSNATRSRAPFNDVPLGCALRYEYVRGCPDIFVAREYTLPETEGIHISQHSRDTYVGFGRKRWPSVTLRVYTSPLVQTILNRESYRTIVKDHHDDPDRQVPDLEFFA